MRLLIRNLAAILLSLMLVGMVVPMATAQGIGPVLPGQGQTAGLPDYAAWDRVATRAERAVEGGTVSTFAMERLRAELVVWRDQFLQAQSTNAARIATVRSQIAALGVAPAEGETEDPTIAARRTTLADQLARLRAPVILAEEAYAQANGLVSEIDGMARERQASQLSERGPSPLNPQSWPRAVATLWEGIRLIGTETTAAFSADMKNGDLYTALPRSGLFLILAAFLLMRGRRWMMWLDGYVMTYSQRGRGVWRFLLSLGQIFLPLLGVVALQEALQASGLLGFRSAIIVSALPDAALFLIVARWLNGHFFTARAEPDAVHPLGEPLSFDAETRERGQRILTGLGWTLSLGALVLAIVSAGDSSGETAAVLVLPIEMLVGVFLYRLGRLLSRAGRVGATAAAYRGRLLRLVGQGCQIIAVAGPALAVAGYATAAEALLYPAVMTLALLAVVILLQRFVQDLYGLLTRAPDGSSEALIPVLIGIFLFLASIPVLALIWGARQQDLFEIWSRFREGFSLGDTRISPTDFMTVVILFTGGYMLTRLVQGTLRSTVLPKTRMDIGGQNAIVSGVGYVGIFAAAIVSITAAGIDLSSLAIVAGALSVGIGFGLQNIVSNFVSGIILLIERPISEGDWIEVAGQMGYVRDISVRSTRIETFDRTDVIIPNADLVSGQVTNWTRGNSVGRIIVPVGVAYGTDTDVVTGILRKIAEDHPMVLLQPPPNIFFMAFGADSLNFEIRAILRDVNFSLTVKSEMNHAISKAFAAAGIEIPFAQRDIWLRNPEVLRSSPAVPANPEPEEPAA